MGDGTTQARSGDPSLHSGQALADQGETGDRGRVEGWKGGRLDRGRGSAEAGVKSISRNILLGARLHVLVGQIC
jgi:hypothetical protein